MRKSILDPHKAQLIEMWNAGNSVPEMQAYLEKEQNLYVTVAGVKSYMKRLKSNGEAEKRVQGWNMKIERLAKHNRARRADSFQYRRKNGIND